MEKLSPHFSVFEELVETTIDKVWHEPRGSEYLRKLAAASSTLVLNIIHIGNLAEEAMAHEETYAPFAVNYLWAEQAKSFIILWRDIIFEEQKAEVLKLESKVNTEMLDTLYFASRDSVQAAFEELKAFTKSQVLEPQLTPAEQQRLVGVWRLQHSPWSVFRSHLEELSVQGSQLVDDFFQLQKISNGLKKVAVVVSETLHLWEEEKETIKKRTEDALALIKESIPEEGVPKPGKIVVKLEDIEVELNFPNYLNILIKKTEAITESFPEKMRVPVDTRGGLIEYKEVAFQKSSQRWLETKVIPPMYEVWELSENIRNSMKVALVNIRNRATLVDAEIKEGGTPEIKAENISQPLHTFLEKLPTLEKEISIEKKRVSRKLSQQFQLSQVYDKERDFLVLPLQSTIDELADNQNKFFKSVKRWGKYQLKVLRKVRSSVEEEATLTNSEKLVRFVKSRSLDEANPNYTMIFLTKGYIGESFWVGRKKELAHMKTLIQNWQEGYRGNVAVVGPRFSGKSLFGELIANRYFSQHTVRLKPNSEIKVVGRKFQTSFDLAEALEFVRKHTLNLKMFIWVDDLELWRDTQVSLSQNVRALKKHMNEIHGNDFIMVSMSSYLRNYLDKIFNMNKIFHSTLSLEKMEVEEIREAILTRHSVTDKVLVNQEGGELNPKEINTIIERVYRSSHGNIGEALNIWAYSMKSEGEDKIAYSPKTEYDLPEFIAADTELLLTSIMDQRRTNEYRLRKLFGPAFKDKYQSILNQLISVGLLKRHPEGWLEINEVGVNELERMLKQKRTWRRV